MKFSQDNDDFEVGNYRFIHKNEKRKTKMLIELINKCHQLEVAGTIIDELEELRTQIKQIAENADNAFNTCDDISTPEAHVLNGIASDLELLIEVSPNNKPTLVK